MKCKNIDYVTPRLQKTFNETVFKLIFDKTFIDLFKILTK